MTRQKAFVAILIMLLGVMLFSGTDFYTAYNLLDMLNSTSILLILAFGVTLTIIAAAATSRSAASWSSPASWPSSCSTSCPWSWPSSCAVLFGVVVGFVNGFLVVHQKTEPFIITLGTGLLLTGVAQQLTDAHPIPAKNPAS